MTTPERHPGWVTTVYVTGVLLVGSLAVTFVGMVAPEPSSTVPDRPPAGVVTPLPQPRVTAAPCYVAASPPAGAGSSTVTVGFRASCPRVS